MVNKVWFLDAVRGELDLYNMGWQRYLEARANDEQRRRRERANAEKKASALLAQAAKMGAKATKAAAAHSDGPAGGEDAVRPGRGPPAPTRSPRSGSRQPAPCGRTPLTARTCPSPTGRWRSSPASTWPSTGAAGWWCSASNGAGKTTLLKLLQGIEPSDTGEVMPGHGLKLGYYAQEHETLDPDATVWENTRHAAPDAGAQELRNLLGSFLFTGEQLEQQAGTLSGGEKTRLALAGLVSSAANVLLLDEPTNNLDPAAASRCSRRCAATPAPSCWSPTMPGAVTALHPERVILLPDGTEDHWSDDYLDLVELA